MVEHHRSWCGHALDMEQAVMKQDDGMPFWEFALLVLAVSVIATVTKCPAM